MKFKALLIASLIAVSTLANATLPIPTEPALRPPGFKHPSVEGVRVIPKSGCSFTQFKTELEANKSTNPDNLYTIERYQDKDLKMRSGRESYAIVYSLNDKTFQYSYGPDVVKIITSAVTYSDGDRLRLLKRLQLLDKGDYTSSSDLTSNTFKSGAYRNTLVAYYKELYDNQSTCVQFQGFEYKARLAGVPTAPISGAFINNSIGWNQKQPLTATQITAMNNTGVAVIDGTWNTASVDPDLTGNVTVVTGLMDQPFETTEVPTTKSSTTDVTHSNFVTNSLAAVKPKVFVLPTAEDGEYIFGAGTNGDTRISAIQKSLQWVINNADTKNIKVVVVSSEIPQESSQKGLYDQYEQLKAMGISVIQSSGNDGIPTINPRASVYPSLPDETGTLSVNGTPVIITGSIGKKGSTGPDYLVTSNYGPNDVMIWTGANNSKLPTRVGTDTQDVDLTQSSGTLLDSYGQSSVAASMTAIAVVYAKAIAPWLTPDQVKVAIAMSGDQTITSMYNLTDFPSYEKEQEEMGRFNSNRGGLLSVLDLYNYIKNYLNEYPIEYVITPWHTTWGLTDATAGGLCTKVRSDLFFVPADSNQPISDGSCKSSTGTIYATIWGDMVSGPCSFGGTPEPISQMCVVTM